MRHGWTEPGSPPQHYVSSPYPVHDQGQSLAPGDDGLGAWHQLSNAHHPARDVDDPTRRWSVVFAIARPWETVEGKALKDLVTQVPRSYFQRLRVPRLPRAPGYTPVWILSKRLSLRHIGDVTVMLR